MGAASVEEAAKRLADTSYPMVKATDWATTDVLDKYMANVPTTKEFSKAILELSVFDATPGVQDLNSAWYAQMPKADADATFEAFKQLADVVKASPEKAIAPVAAPSMDGPVGAAAKKLADASYPMLQKVNWANTGVLNKYVTNTPANKAGISALLDAGLAMDMKTVQGATQAHLDAVNAVDGSLLTPLANHEAVTVAIAKLIASAPPAKIKAVFDTVPRVEGLNFDWFSTMSVPDAVKSYQAFLETAAAVKSSR